MYTLPFRFKLICLLRNTNFIYYNIRCQGNVVIMRFVFFIIVPLCLSGTSFPEVSLNSDSQENNETLQAAVQC